MTTAEALALFPKTKEEIVAWLSHIPNVVVKADGHSRSTTCPVALRLFDLTGVVHRVGPLNVGGGPEGRSTVTPYAIAQAISHFDTNFTAVEPGWCSPLPVRQPQEVR